MRASVSAIFCLAVGIAPSFALPGLLKSRGDSSRSSVPHDYGQGISEDPRAQFTEMLKSPGDPSRSSAPHGLYAYRVKLSFLPEVDFTV
ncbi:hypothetical protein F5148DRAFT_1235982 [Russula earlei]|uniref:Uncharacterized protein n=1 Tax=Russula earlei TaxID=71964 RepID=A0ACC0TX58_9AGAM|nr:hypothetical protein F5148DRAFT_1235982 [Russula earlei]